MELDKRIIYGIIGGIAFVLLIVLCVLIGYLCSLQRRIDRQKQRQKAEQRALNRYSLQPTNSNGHLPNQPPHDPTGRGSAAVFVVNPGFTSDYAELDTITSATTTTLMTTTTEKREKTEKKQVRFMDAPVVIESDEEADDDPKSFVQFLVASYEDNTNQETFTNHVTPVANGHVPRDDTYYSHKLVKNHAEPEAVYMSTEEIRRVKRDSLKRNNEAKPPTPTSPAPPDVPPKGPEALQDNMSLNSLKT